MEQLSSLSKMTKLRPSKYDIKELLEALNQPKSKDDDYSAYKNDVLLFMNEFEINPGNQRINKSTLYHLYRQWSQTPVDYMPFINEFGKYFRQHWYKNEPIFRINAKATSLATKVYNFTIKGKKDKRKSKTYKKHFESFLNEHKIQRGDIWMESYVLFHMYDKWNYQNKRNNKLTKETFYQYCKLYLEHRNRYLSKYLWFKVSPAIYEVISQVSLENIREGLRFAHVKQAKFSKRQRQKNKKKSIQVSKSKP